MESLVYLAYTNFYGNCEILVFSIKNNFNVKTKFPQKMFVKPLISPKIYTINFGQYCFPKIILKHLN